MSVNWPIREAVGNHQWWRDLCILTMPFESLAVDIIGPFTKCKGGVRYELTTLCLATKLPDVVPLRSVT